MNHKLAAHPKSRQDHLQIQHLSRVQACRKDDATGSVAVLRRFRLKRSVATVLALGVMSLPFRATGAAEIELPSSIAAVYDLNGPAYTAVLTDILPSGTLNVGSAGAVRVYAARTLNNRGVLNITGRISLTQAAHFSNFGTLNNNGTIIDFLTIGQGVFRPVFRNEAGATLSNNGLLSFTKNTQPTNLGTLINTGSLIVRDTMNNIGTLTLATGSSLDMKYIFGALNNTGTLTLAAGSSFDLSGATLNNTGTVNLQRNFTLGAAASGTVNLSGGGTVVNTALLTNSAGHWQDNYGTLNNRSGKSFINNGYFVSYGTLVNAGTLTNTRLLSLKSGSNFNFAGGTLNNTGDFELQRDFSFGVASAGTVNLNAGGKVLNYSTLTNIAGHTQVNVGTLYNPGSGTFNNAGTFNTTGLIENDGVLSNTGSLVNAGTLLNRYRSTLTLAAGSSYNFTGGTLANAGTINLQRNFTFGAAKAGTVELNAGGTLVNAAVLSNTAGHTQANAGTVNNQDGKTFSNAGAFSNTGNLINAGTLGNTGTLTLAAGSSYNFTGGTLNNTGTVNLNRDFSFGGATAGIVNLNAGGTLNSAALLTNASGHSQSNAGALNNQTGATLANLGSLTNSGALTNAGSFTNSGTFTNTGTGTVTGTGNFTQTAGVSRIDGNFVQNQVSLQGGQMLGTGTIASVVVNDTGVIQAGAVGAPGTLGIDGSFVQRAAGTLRALIGGTAAGQSSLIAVSGPISLAGTLELGTVNGYSFAAGDSLTLLTFAPGSLTGSFDNVVYGALASLGTGPAIGAGLLLDVHYNNNLGNVQLSVTTAVPEPANWALILSGLGLVGWVARRRKPAAAPAHRA
jgi:hypothetical protein